MAGSFYPGDPALLRQTVSNFINNAPRLMTGVRGLVAPHAGYVYSGAVAGVAYRQVEVETPDGVIVLSPSHQAFINRAVIYRGDYETPLGRIRTDTALADVLLSAHPALVELPALHAQEHALEVQLPFLQVLFGEALVILPVVLSGAPALAEILATALIQAIGDKHYLVVASSDLSHYHPDTVARKKDQLALDLMIRGDIAGLMQAAEKKDAELCGLLPVLTLLHLATHFHWDQRQRLRYSHSGEVSGDMERVVGYGAVGFAAPQP